MANQTATDASPWHDGEKTLHKKLGVAETMAARGGRAIRSFMPDQHRQFFEQLPFIVAGAVDDEGDVWATLISGRPGFLHSPSDTRLDVSAVVEPSDPAVSGFEKGASLAFLGIELHTRRRNRMNGKIRAIDHAGFSVDVEHSFGNCPQYIQLRDYAFVREPSTRNVPLTEEKTALDARARAMIEKADTFFVASYVDLDHERQVDVSHRGGKAGFVRVGEDGVLTIPDYAGNLHFNTLGNFIKNPKAGLIFPDFETGDVWQLTGEARVVLDSPEIEAFEGAERLWTFRPRRVVYRRDALPLRWSFNGFSPNSLMTGSWEEARARLDAEQKRLEWRPFRVTKIVDESSVIKSFWLEPADGGGMTRHKAGQHLPIRVKLPTEAAPTLRTYTLSVAPSNSAYRISIKRDGAVSSFLHDKIFVGDMIDARAPQGDFIVDEKETRPIVMLAAGVGITPFAAMLRHLSYEGKRTRRFRPVWLFQAARTIEDRAFDVELSELAQSSGGAFRLVRMLSEANEPDDPEKGVQGRISIDFLKTVLPFDDYDFYLCGPSSFMETLYNGLRDLNVPDQRIFFEAFGPASVKRRPDKSLNLRDGDEVRAKPSGEPVPVSFAKSAKDARWTPKAGSLLDLAEENDLSPPFSCRMGNCGSCKTRIKKGAVAYESPPSYPVEEGEALICCAVPAVGADEDGLVLDL